MLSNIEKGDTLAISTVPSKASHRLLSHFQATGGDYKYTLSGGSVNYHAGFHLTGVARYAVSQ